MGRLAGEVGRLSPPVGYHGATATAGADPAASEGRAAPSVTAHWPRRFLRGRPACERRGRSVAFRDCGNPRRQVSRLPDGSVLRSRRSSRSGDDAIDFCVGSARRDPLGDSRRGTSGDARPGAGLRRSRVARGDRRRPVARPAPERCDPARHRRSSTGDAGYPPGLRLSGRWRRGDGSS
jgi:hypothetical protein